MRFLRKCVVLALLGPLATGAAHAEPTSADMAAAEILFREGLRLLDEQRAAEACPKFEESLKLEPAAGTALNLGDCYERIGRIASAYGTFDQAAALAHGTGDESRAEEAKRRRQALESKLAKITVVVPAPHRVVGLSVLRDGRSLGSGQWGIGVPVDPGTHTVEATAPGRRGWKTVVQVSAAPGTVQIAIPELAKEKTASPQPEYRAGQRLAGILVGSAGLAGLAVGGGFAIAAANRNEASLKHCLPDDPNKCYAKGVLLRNESLAYADTSTVVTSISAMAFATGTVLFLTAGFPRAPERSARVWVMPQVSAHTAGISFGGAW